MRRCATTLEAEMTAEEHELLMRVLGEEKHTGLHLEIGTAAGGTLWRMMQSFGEEQRPRFVVVDPMSYFPDQLDLVKKNLRDNGVDPNQVEFRVGTSAEMFRQAEQRGDRFDFMLIDGSHKVMAVMGDLRWTRLLNVGGILAMHDYSLAHKGVYYPAKRFMEWHANYERVGLAGSLLALRKKEESPRPEVGVRDWVFATMMYLPLQVERKLEKLKRKDAAQAG
jgi:predicted O-methyltransferase YrrM